MFDDFVSKIPRINNTISLIENLKKEKTEKYKESLLLAKKRVLEIEQSKKVSMDIEKEPEPIKEPESPFKYPEVKQTPTKMEEDPKPKQPPRTRQPRIKKQPIEETPMEEIQTPTQPQEDPKPPKPQRRPRIKKQPEQQPMEEVQQQPVETNMTETPKPPEPVVQQQLIETTMEETQPQIKEEKKDYKRKKEIKNSNEMDLFQGNKTYDVDLEKGIRKERKKRLKKD
ncbi:hypothetical protein ACTFIY_004588 [Dictyostelium cf. discoideum]